MPSDRSNLENLVRVRQLNAEPPGKRELENLLRAADQVLRDARKAELSAESRFSPSRTTRHTRWRSRHCAPRATVPRAPAIGA